MLERWSREARDAQPKVIKVRDPALDERRENGIILEVHRRTSVVLPAAGDTEVNCHYGPNLNFEGHSRLAVGDLVEFVRDDSLGGILTGLLPRRSCISRPGPEERRHEEHVLAANVDIILAVFSVVMPELNLGMLQRYLAAAEKAGIPPLICLNKADLDGSLPEEVRYLESIGYPVVNCSAATGAGLDALRQKISGKTSVLSGPSGVGKSSLIKSLKPEVTIRIGDVRAGDGKGRHTTTSSHLYRLDGQTAIIDTPGIRELGLWGVTRGEVGRLFPDIAALAETCRFRDCRHLDEPGCAVRDAESKGALPSFRYHAFLRIKETLSD